MSTSRIDTTDHDQRFKVLIREFLCEFITLFFIFRARSVSDGGLTRRLRFGL
jgi:hypothetical protein